ncbi:MAG TPA: NlpC/P60 family protein [Acidimicrobiales bacterium]|nr:NlpC/P60 family protein [Acidimicrobiales bacterium]
MRTSTSRRAGALLVLAALVCGIADVSIAAAPASAADAVADKKAEAERIARQLEQQSRQVSILAEEYDAARVKIDALGEELADASAKVARTDATATAIRTRLKAQSVDAYVRGGSMPALAMLAETSVNDDLAVRLQYVRTVTSGATDVLDQLREVRQELDVQRDRLDAAKAEAKAAADLAESKRQEAATAAAAQKDTLRKVQGELATLVEVEAKRRAEEEARRVQAELAAKKARDELAAKEAAARDAAAREAAARKAATTTTAKPDASDAVAPIVTTRPSTTTTTAPRTTTTTPSSGTGLGSGSGSGAPAAGADAAVAEARRQLGKPYEWGGAGPDSFDCSGLTSWAWRAGGERLSHSSQAQWSETSRVSLDNLQPGDLLFYGTPIHHVGIFIGDGQMIEAPETGKNVRVGSIYRSDIVGAGRVH